MIRKGTIEEAVANALQPAYFFAMFEEDVQVCTRLVASRIPFHLLPIHMYISMTASEAAGLASMHLRAIAYMVSRRDLHMLWQYSCARP